MNWFLHFPTRAKLLIGFGLIVVLLMAISVLSYNSIVSIQRAQEAAAEDSTIAIDLLTLFANSSQNRASVLMILFGIEPEEQIKWMQGIEEQRRQNSALLEQLMQRAAHKPELLRKIQAFAEARENYAQIRDEQVLPAARAGNLELARSISLGAQRQRFAKLTEQVISLTTSAEESRLQAQRESARTADRASITLISACVLAILISLVLALFLSRMIADPLQEISGAAERMAVGDLTATIGVNHRSDEVGALAESFRRMMRNMREMNRDISEGVNLLSSSTSEILAATTEIASGAAETASAVSQTTTTVEQVKQTADVSKQKARNVADIAHRAAQASQAGRKSVDEAVEGMSRVQDQMESIAESIVRLSEQNQAIGEIITTVNDLAEQSNLLAVNASIEAAKAGEQGRGFAVVAQEVKNLAVQSKQATAQVRRILGEIQKATSGAVMTTEQGSKAVEAGVKQSSQAGESIRILATSITEAAQAATQITASSEQQFVGMDQVARAMENIKLAASQNVNGTRQAEAGARSLHELGEKLKLLVERFKT
jgi:methyl-accepting chemotaxis protein